MPLNDVIGQTMAALETDADEIAVADAEKCASAACSETVSNVFRKMNG